MRAPSGWGSRSFNGVLCCCYGILIVSIMVTLILVREVMLIEVFYCLGNVTLVLFLFFWVFAVAGTSLH